MFVAGVDLSNNKGDFFQLNVEGYEFPDNTTCFSDANWLVVKGRVSLGGKLWEFRDPCFLNWEALNLVEWLNDVSDGLPTEPKVAFTEPELEFRLTNSGSVRVYFEFNARPRWAPYNGFMEDLFIELEPNQTNLKSSAYSLRQQLANFPVRAINDG